MPKLLLLLVLSVFLLDRVALAEFECRSTISFKVDQEKGSGKSEEKISREVPYSGLTQKGADEATAKTSIEERILREKGKALQACRNRHENLAGCMASKLSSLSTTLQGLNFSERKALEDAVVSDCKTQQGKCVEVVSSEVKCSEIIVKTEAESGEKAGGKDGKKDGKKK